ncbi:MAG: M23 family metallopeptidase [Campylobacter sp.]|nr:M23 family metallopeptidase [Campylobacter sp.]
MRRSYRRNDGSKFKFVALLALLGLIVFGIVKIFTSPLLEQNPPKIELENQIYWNLTSPLKFKVSDDTGIKKVVANLIDNDKKIALKDEEYGITQKELEISLEFPKNLILNNHANYDLEVAVSDISKWNFALGNESKATSKIIVDNKKPTISVINQSYKITKGGAAVVVFKAGDEMLDRVFVRTNYGKEFSAVPFEKDGFYAALIAWPANLNEFRADVVATDKAGNLSNSQIHYFYQDKNYKVSNIALTQKFIDGKVSELVEIYAQNPSKLEGIDKFKFVNEVLREENAKLIKNATSKIHEEKFDKFEIRAFSPLKNAAAVASYGDHRIYSWQGEKLSESWHMGLDLASTAAAPIIESNYGVVVETTENGIYGLNIVVYYGFGLYGIYAHCTSSNVSIGDQVKPGDILGNTGATGFAFGDHLHFGTIVQGVETRPEEWMDPKWMKDNIFDILENAKKTIKGEK